MFKATHKQHMSTAALSRANKVDLFLMFTRVSRCIIPPASGPAPSSSNAPVLLCTGLVTPDTEPSAHSLLMLRLGGAGREGAGGHTCSDASRRRCSVRSGGGKMKANTES